MMYFEAVWVQQNASLTSRNASSVWALCAPSMYDGTPQISILAHKVQTVTQMELVQIAIGLSFSSGDWYWWSILRLASRLIMMSGPSPLPPFLAIDDTVGARNRKHTTYAASSKMKTDNEHTRQLFTTEVMESVQRPHVDRRLESSYVGLALLCLLGTLLPISGVNFAKTPRQGARYLVTVLLLGGSALFMYQISGLSLFVVLLFIRDRPRRYCGFYAAYSLSGGATENDSTAAVTPRMCPFRKYTRQSLESDEVCGSPADSSPVSFIIHPCVPVHNYFSPLKPEETTFTCHADDFPSLDPSLLRYTLALEASAYRRILIQRVKKASPEPRQNGAAKLADTGRIDKSQLGVVVPAAGRHCVGTLISRALHIPYLFGTPFCPRWLVLKTCRDVRHTFSSMLRFSSITLAKQFYGNLNAARVRGFGGASLSGRSVFTLVSASNFGDEGSRPSHLAPTSTPPLLQAPRYIANLTELNLEHHVESSDEAEPSRHGYEEFTVISSYVTAWIGASPAALSAGAGRSSLGRELGALGASLVHNLVRRPFSHQSGSCSSAGRFSFVNGSEPGSPASESLTPPRMESLSTGETGTSLPTATLSGHGSPTLAGITSPLMESLSKMETETETLLPTAFFSEEWILGSRPDTSSPIHLSQLGTVEGSPSPTPSVNHPEEQVSNETALASEDFAIAFDSSQTTRLAHGHVDPTDLMLSSMSIVDLKRMLRGNVPGVAKRKRNRPGTNIRKRIKEMINRKEEEARLMVDTTYPSTIMSLPDGAVGAAEAFTTVTTVPRPGLPMAPHPVGDRHLEDLSEEEDEVPMVTSSQLENIPTDEYLREVFRQANASYTARFELRPTVPRARSNGSPVAREAWNTEASASPSSDPISYQQQGQSGTCLPRAPCRTDSSETASAAWEPILELIQASDFGDSGETPEVNSEGDGASQAQEAGAATGPGEEVPTVEQLRECLTRIFTATANFQLRGAQHANARAQLYGDQVTVECTLAVFMERLENWLRNPMGGDRDDLRIVVDSELQHFHRALHLAFREYHTRELSNATRLKRLHETSAPIPAAGVIFVLLVGVDLYGIPSGNRAREAQFKDSLQRVGLSLADDVECAARVQTAHCLRFIGDLDGDNLINVEVTLNVNTADQQTALYDLVNGRTKLCLKGDVIPVDVVWLYQGSEFSPKVKLVSYSVSMWMSFHHLVLGLSPRACVAALLKWLVDGLRTFERGPLADNFLAPNQTLSDKLTGIDFISSIPSAEEGARRQRIPFYHPRTQWMVVFTDSNSAEIFDDVLNHVDFALPFAGQGTFRGLATFENGLRPSRRAPTEAAFLRSMGVFLPQTLSLRPAAPMVFKVMLILNPGISTLIDIYGGLLGRHVALGQQRAAILHGLRNIFMFATGLNMLTQPGLSGIEVDTAQVPTRTNGQWISWSFGTLEKARTFAQGLQFIVTHRLTQEQVEEARAQTRIGRGLRWSPFVGFWGTECCQWLHNHSNSIRIELARSVGRHAQTMALAGQILNTCRGYHVEDAQGVQVGAAEGRGQIAGGAVGRPQITDAAPAAGAAEAGATGGEGGTPERVAVRRNQAAGAATGRLQSTGVTAPQARELAAGAARGGGRKEKREREAGAREQAKREGSGAGEEGEGERMHD